MVNSRAQRYFLFATPASLALVILLIWDNVGNGSAAFAALIGLLAVHLAIHAAATWATRAQPIEAPPAIPIARPFVERKTATPPVAFDTTEAAPGPAEPLADAVVAKGSAVPLTIDEINRPVLDETAWAPPAPSGGRPACGALTAAGQPCKNRARAGDATCLRHDGYQPSSKVPAEVPKARVTARKTPKKTSAEPPSATAKAASRGACEAITANATACSNSARQGSPYCGIHRAYQASRPVGDATPKKGFGRALKRRA